MVNPSHESLPKELALRVCALGQQPLASERDAVIIALCELRPHTCGEIAAVLEREEPYVRALLKALLAKNLVSVTEGHYHRPPAETPRSGDEDAR